MAGAVLDGMGNVLQIGDGVASLRAFDAGYHHMGYVGDINYATGRISVKHAMGCCEPGLISEDCEPTLWQHCNHAQIERSKQEDAAERPTAWMRILRDD